MAINFQPIYVLASGGKRALEQLDITANNIANADTPGFKKILMKEMSQYIPKNQGNTRDLFVFPRFESSPVLLKQGDLEETGEPLDIAIQGDGFFNIQTPNGVFYTRNGHFFLDSEGYIVDPNGNYLLDENGSRIQLESQENITITEEGEVFQGSDFIAKIKISNFLDVKPLGSSYYTKNGNEIPAEVVLQQGFLERSNINPVDEMVNLIEAQRRFEIYGNLMRSLDSMEHKANEIGRA